MSVSGNKDEIQENFICGPGYEPPGNATTVAFAIDASPPYANDAKVKNNVVCPSPPVSMMSVLSADVAPAAAAATATRAAQPVK